MTGKLGKHGFLAAWSLLLVACGGNVQSPDFVSKLEDIQLSPTTASIKLGDTLQLRVNGLYSLPPGSTGGVACPATSASERCETRPMAGSTFSVDKADLATIDGNGLLKANKRGTVVVSAKSGDITRSANVGITGVVLCDITITPAQASVALGRSQGFSANGVFSENCASTTASRSTGTISGTITWSSSNTGVAAITAQGQRDTVASTMGKTVGQTTIRASAADAEGTTVTSSDASAATLTVTVAELERLNISPSGLSIARGQQGVFNLTGTYSDGNTRIVSPETVAWTVGGGNDTADTNVRIDDQTNSAARLTALSSGTVGASSLVRATATKPDSSTVNVTGTVTISNAVLTGIQQITPDNLSIPQGNTLQYNVTGMFSDGTSGVVDTTQFPVDWISSDPIVASIDITTGLATPGNTEAAIGGTTTITVTLRNGVAPGATPRTDTTTLTVTDQICRVPFTTANAGTTGTGTGGGAASGCLSTAANACTITNAGNLVTPSRDDSAQFNIAPALNGYTLNLIANNPTVTITPTTSPTQLAGFVLGVADGSAVNPATDLLVHSLNGTAVVEGGIPTVVPLNMRKGNANLVLAYITVRSGFTGLRAQVTRAAVLQVPPPLGQVPQIPAAGSSADVLQAFQACGAVAPP